MFRPMLQIAGTGNSDSIGTAVPLSISEDISAVLGLDDPWILYTPRPLASLLSIPIRIEHRLLVSLKVNTVRALGQSQARRVHSNLYGPAIVLGTIQHVHLTCSHDRS